MKKIFSILWGISAIVLSAISCTFAYTQEQIDAYQWAYKYGITTQPNIEAAKLNWNVTRQAFAKMVVNYLENVVWVKQTTSNSCKFTDESKITNDLRPYTRKTCAYDIMGSNWSDFRPMNPLTRAQLWTVLSRILRWDEYNNGGKWYYIYHLNMLKEKWIMNSTKNPDAYAKRWDVLVMLKRMYEKFGSNVHMNLGNTSSNSSNIINVGTGDNSFSFSTENDDDDYISTVYDNSNVIYTSKDGTKYYYDDKFLNMLKDTADKKWESDLTDYLKIEAEYFKNWLDQLADLDDEDILESMWIDIDDIEPDEMTKQEKQELIKKFKIALGKVIDENKSKNNQLLKDLEKITKNIKNDKFWLKEKYSKTKTFMEASNEFLDLYSESILDLIEFALMKEEGDESDEWIAQAFWLIWIALAYQWTAQEYQTYVEEWAVNTLKSLWEEVDSNNKVQMISKDELKEIPWDWNETFVNNMRYNRPKADYKIIDNKWYYMEQTDICKITDENWNTYNEKAYSLGRYYEFTIDPSASVNTRWTSQWLKYVFEKENLIWASEAKAANQLTTSFSEIWCHYVDLTVQDVNIWKQDKVRIWFNVKN